ncbi:protein CROWDED NUCLEI 4-like [Hibiscus syriacus]|uniref:protein CROWDED NUCLEI 4-like n=1 Tax=Hibiscus syriacus TaxID=106335 RepID=UPI0019231135|nr:protein CROWDED NUCLEI 4-like [Hibiscus syriacus]
MQAIIEREIFLSKKEKELLVSQEKLANKESGEFRKVIASHENALRTRNSEFEGELELKRKMVEDGIEMKRRAWELKEMDINHKEDQICEREHDLDVRLRILAEKEKEVAEKSNLIDLSAFEKELELKKVLLEKEKEEMSKTKLELQESLSLLEDKRNQVDRANEKLEALRRDTHELLTLELKLKEELDIVRAQKLELIADVDKLRVSNHGWKQHVFARREAISKYLKDERDRLKWEREHNKDVESLNREREDFMKKMRELENSIEKSREELESSLKEREEAFEREKKNQLDHIIALKEITEEELEQATSEMRRLDAERLEIKLDRERREREWAELNKSIEEVMCKDTN